MEPFQNNTGKSQGIEVLYFEDAEICKSRADQTSFAAYGGLSVLYFKDLSRFFLRINDWTYPLLRKLTISSSSTNDSRSYILPAPNGFSYCLNINNVANSQALDNLDTILDNNSLFSVVGKEIAYRKLEASPELTRRALRTNPKEIITETVKKAFNQVKNTAATLRSGTKNITSRKKKVDLEKLRNKDFSAEAKSRIKKGFLESSKLQSNEFREKRRNNSNLTEKKEFDQLKNTSATQAPSLFICKAELEDRIDSIRSIFGPIETPQKVEQTKGLVTNLREGARNIRNRVSDFLGRKPLETPEVEQNESVPLPENVVHYQG